MESPYEVSVDHNLYSVGTTSSVCTTEVANWSCEQCFDYSSINEDTIAIVIDDGNENNCSSETSINITSNVVSMMAADF